MASDIRVELNADGVREASEMWEGFAYRATDVKPAWEAFARFLMASEVRHFQRTRAEMPPLDADTIRQKGNDRILDLSGTLRRALTVWRAPGQKLRIGKQSMTFGLKPDGVAYYGVFHQEGQSVPKRPPLVLPWDADRRAADFVLDHLMGRL